jgi:hypothetical protein
MANTFSKPPGQINLGILTNHFAKSTKYMIEESEHYMDGSKVHKSPATSFDPEPDAQDKHTTRSGPPKAVTATYFAEAEHVTILLLAPGLWWRPCGRQLQDDR